MSNLPRTVPNQPGQPYTQPYNPQPGQQYNSQAGQPYNSQPHNDSWALMDKQRREMEDQDKALDYLSQSILRQKEMAETIGNQVDDSIKLIDDIDKGTRVANKRVATTTHRVEKFEAEHSTKFLWCIIFILILALVVVAGMALYT